jgi:hypothetical protein
MKKKEIDKNKIIVAVFLDFKRAFETIFFLVFSSKLFEKMNEDLVIKRVEIQ